MHGAEGKLGELQVGLGIGVGVEDDLLEGQGQTDGGDEGCEAWRSAQGAVGEAFGPDGDEDGDDSAAYQHRWEGYPHGCAVWQNVQVDRECAEAAGHEDLAVGEVDELDDAVHHRVADGDQPVHRAEEQPVGQLLRQGVHRVASMWWGELIRAYEAGRAVTCGRGRAALWLC